jgi:hypothetical protein
LNAPIAASNSADGMSPASEFAVAFTKTMTRMTSPFRAKAPE